MRQNFACYQYINEGIEHTFKTVSKKFEIRVPFNCESKEFNLHRNFQWLQGRIYRAITANRCPEAYKDMWWWKFQNYASLCSLARQQNLKRVIWDIFHWKIETWASAETVRLRRIFALGDLVKSLSIFCSVQRNTSFQWDLIYAHKYLTSSGLCPSTFV